MSEPAGGAARRRGIAHVRGRGIHASRHRPTVVLGLLAALTLGVAACGASPSPSASVPSAGTSSPSITDASGEPSAASPGVSAIPGETVVVDSSLLGLLPATVDGLAIVESADGEAAALRDTGISDLASAVASGLAIDGTSGDFVFATVVRLLPGAMDDTRYRDWRDSYDEGACEQASGVGGHAEATIGSRTVYIGTCAGGVRTYHVWLTGPNVLVSASAYARDDARRLGEKLIEGLRS